MRICYQIFGICPHSHLIVVKSNIKYLFLRSVQVLNTGVSGSLDFVKMCGAN